ncbi:YjcZ family sporulation protein [Sporolactobacillus sp. KGMB 08714]
MGYDDGSSSGYSGTSMNFALIVVLFILLIIVGTAFVY